MNKTEILILKSLRKAYQTFSNPKVKAKPICEQDPDIASEIIYKALLSDKPFMIARFGANELACVTNYLSVKIQKHNIFSYIKGDQFDWWWNSNIINKMYVGAGFFPPEIDKIEQFCESMLEVIPQVDFLGSWLASENNIEHLMGYHHKIKLIHFDPFWSSQPWTRALEGKKVLVVHPYASTIEKQYKNRELIFKNNLLPVFELHTIKAVQSIAGLKTEFSDWFEALEHMKSQINKIDFDICLIGAGAYGFPLAAHVKQIGKKGFHIGGSLQLLFGIRGKRWERENYNSDYNYTKLMNEYWVRPGDEETPLNANAVENACYW